MNVSLIIPVKNDYESFKKVFFSLIEQSLKPKEIIIIDSSDDNIIKKFLNNFENKIKIIYVKEVSKFPGEARNIGSRYANFEYIALLDSKTIPIKHWLEIQCDKLKKNNLDIVFGNTKYLAKNYVQNIIRSATFGNITHTTTPGSLMKKNVLLNNQFIEKVRTADDLEWRERLIYYKYKFSIQTKTVTHYESLPNSLFTLLKRYFTYSFHTAQVNVDNKIKFFYFVLISLLLFLLIPRWNQYLPSWNSSHPLFIQNQTKFILLLFLSIVIMIVSLQNLPFLKKGKFNNLIKFILISGSIYFVYNWNYLVANFIEKSIFYFPHITKIFLVIIFLTSFIIRGIYYPIIRGVDKATIFPIKWIQIGFYGFLIDLVKTPAYLYGALLPNFFLRKNKESIKKNNLIFYPKYGFKSPSFRIRFLSYEKYLKNNNINIVTKELFDDIFYDNKIYNNKIQKIRLIISYFLRIKDLLFRKKPFIPIIHIELLPYIPFLAETILKIRKIPYIIDIDDAVYLRFENSNKFLYFIDKLKFKYMFKNSERILAGNNFHVNYLNKYNSQIDYIPTNIDFNKYNVKNYNKKYKKFTIVWIGTPSTSFYLKPIIPVLNKIIINKKIDIVLIGADKNIVKNLNCKFLEWDYCNEIEEISKCHLGIMPLNNTKWELGKCAYKILQYMALKLSVVASPVGVNKEIIINEYNGMLASSDAEWYNSIEQIIDNPNLYKKISDNGFNTVKKNFDLNNYKIKYLNIVNDIFSKS